MANDQKFYKAEADALFPAGCKCGNNGGGDCDWCGVYYYGPEHEGFDRVAASYGMKMSPEMRQSLTINKRR